MSGPHSVHQHLQRPGILEAEDPSKCCLGGYQSLRVKALPQPSGCHRHEYRTGDMLRDTQRHREMMPTDR